MARERHLSSPPITEAVLDFIFDNPVTTDQLRELGKSVLAVNDGWSLDELNRVETTFNAFSGEQSKVSHDFEGVQLKSAHVDGELGRVYQYRSNRVTVSHVGAYKDWDCLQDDMLMACGFFSGLSGDKKVSRIGVRYINLLPITSSASDLLCDSPDIPCEGGQLTDYMSRSVYSCESGHKVGRTVATVAKVESGGGSAAVKSLMLDIDVVKSVSFDFDTQEMLGALQVLRSVKNKVFFDSLNESALEGF